MKLKVLSVLNGLEQCPTGPLSTYSLHLLQDCMLDVDVFKHSLDNHVSLFKAAVIQLARQVGQYGVPLK